MIRAWLKHTLATRYPGVDFDVMVPPDSAMGDYSINLAFALAKKEKKNLLQVAQEITAQLNDVEYFEQVIAVAPGFVNFYLHPVFLQQELQKIHAMGLEYGATDIGNGKKVIVEYSAPNIAKPMHVGHLRSTIIGDALANVYVALGYQVTRWNYVGDWGTQFGKLLVAYKRWGSEEEVKKNPIDTLVALYVRFHKELEQHPELEQEAQAEFKKLEEGELESRRLWYWFKEESLQEFTSIYHALGISFDVTKGESAYEDQLQPLVEDLQEKGLVKRSEGSLIIDLESVNLPPALVQKSDGASLYITRDIVSLKDRLTEYAPTKILYVVANQQALHFQQLFAIAQLLDLTSAELLHVKYGLVLGEDGKKFSTREGNAVPLQEVIDKITTMALDVVRKKNPDLPVDEASLIAQAVGIGALKYNDLKQHPYSDIVFDWEAMLDLSGNSGPYLQYTYARLMNIVRKAGTSTGADVATLIAPEERALMRHLLDFPDAIAQAAEHSALNGLALYLYELASLASRYYETVRILEDEQVARQAARVLLITTVSMVLERGLRLLGIQTLSRI